MSNGLSAGEEFTFGMIDPQSGETIYSTDATYAFGDGTYSCNGLSGLSSLIFESSSTDNNDPWGDEPDTDCNATILIPSTTVIKLNGVYINTGS